MLDKPLFLIPLPASPQNKNECHKPKKYIHIEHSHIVKQSTTIMRNKNLKMETIRNTYISSRKESQMLL